LPEHHEPTLIEKFVLLVLKQSLGGVTKTAERFLRRAIRMVIMALAGVVIASLGVAFLAVGAVKWFSFLMPNWLAWAIVVIILILLGIILALARR